MARIPKFIPVKTLEGWRVSVPPHLSNTDTRQRRFFERKTEADGFIARLKLRREVHGTGARLLTPAQEEQAAAAFRLLSDAGITTTLSAIVGQHLASIEKSKASKPFLEAFDIFVNSKNRRPAYKRALDSLRRISEPLHSKLLRDIPANEIEDVVASMGPAHRNQRLRELRAVFNYGLKKGWTDKNPIHGMDFVQRQVAEPQVYEPGEITTLLATAERTEHRLIPLLCLGAFAGIRHYEILSLQWRNIDLVERSIDMSAEQTKKGRRRSMEINDTLFAWLQWYVARHGIQVGPISAWSGIWSVRVPMRKLHQAAGIPLKQNALRHSFASYHLTRRASDQARCIVRAEG
jgi:integrase